MQNNVNQIDDVDCIVYVFIKKSNSYFQEYFFRIVNLSAK